MSLVPALLSLVERYWLLASVALVLARLIHNRYGHGLSKVPGPFFASLSDLWLFVHYYRRRGLKERDIHVAYGSPLIRLGPNTVSVSDPEALKIIYGWKPILRKVSVAVSMNQFWAVANKTVILNRAGSIYHSTSRRKTERS
jgi:hypothetical protein